MIKNNIYILIILLIVSCFSEDVEPKVIQNINPIDFNKLINKEEGIILDVRTLEEINLGHIEDATNIDFYASDFTDKLNIIRKDIPIYVYCRSGGRSAKAAQKMKELGFNKIYNLLGGFSKWKSNNFKIVLPEDKIFKKQKSISISDFSEMIKVNDIVLVNFSTQWCVPCKKMKPIIEEIKEENKNVKVFSVDADRNKDIINKYSIEAVPVFIVYKNGVEDFRHIGMIDKNELVNKIK